MEEIFKNIKNIAVVGFSPNTTKDSFVVGAYLIDKGFNVYPIYPKEDEICGQKVYRNLLEIPDEIDTVVMFRKGEYASKLINDVIAKKVKTFWLQVGIVNEEAKNIAQNHNINFIQDKCIMVEHMNLNNNFSS